MLNKATLIGNLGKAPEIREAGGKKVATFSLATSKSYKKDGERVTDTTWHNIVLWGSLAELAGKYLEKGSKIYLEGEIRNRSYTDKEGNKKYITEIVGNQITFLSQKSTQESEPQNTPADNGEDDLPF